ncbi:10798_t:CDS:2, partial [Cetraspora pellucida]
MQGRLRDLLVIPKLKRKRKAEEELVITKPKKRRWEVNSAIQPSIVHAIYFVDPIEESRPLLEKIQEGQFVALHGPRASGKSTQVLQLQEQLKNDFICIYTSFEHVNFTKEIDFWKTFSMSLQRNVPELLGSSENPIIKSAQDFCNIFHRTKWTSFSDNRVVLFVDEFDKLYEATDEIRSSCLETLRGIKNMKQDFSIHFIVTISPFSILRISTKKSTTSPFNVQELFRNPNFTMEQVQFLYKQFSDEFKLTIDQEVIDDIYMQTNGHAGLVCLCGRAIYRKLLAVLENRTHLSFEIWEHFTAFLLGNEILEYSTFIRMKESLLRDGTDIRRAVKLIRTDFLVSNDPIYVADNKNDLALFLTAEGVLVPGEDAGTYKISSPLVHWLVLQRIIPHVFPTSPQTEVPYHSSPRTLDIFKVLKQTVLVFDKEIIKSLRSYKVACVLVNNAKNERVPRESVYDVEFYWIISNWLGGFTITGQWHLKYLANGHINNKYIDIVISRSDHPTIAFELLSTATKQELKEHYERAFLYDNKLPADETWGLRVVYIWHDLDFTKIKMIACWWNNNTKHVTDVEEIM